MLSMNRSNIREWLGGRGRVPGAAGWADTADAAGQGPALVTHAHHAGVREYIVLYT